MIPEKKNISYKNPIKKGYIILSENKSREEYIKYSLRTQTINVITYDEDIYEECSILGNFTSNIDGEYGGISFPDKVGEYGSPVILLFSEGASNPVILGYVAGLENSVITKENQKKRIFSRNDETIIEVDDVSNQAEKTITIISKKGKAKLNINVISDNKESEINLKTDNEINLFAKKLNKIISESVNLKVRNLVKQNEFLEVGYTLKEGLKIKDEFGNIVIINANGIEVNTTTKIKMIIDGSADITASGAMTVDASKIDIGNADSLAINVNTPCLFTGTPHAIPPGNQKTKV